MVQIKGFLLVIVIISIFISSNNHAEPIKMDRFKKGSLVLVGGGWVAPTKTDKAEPAVAQAVRDFGRLASHSSAKDEKIVVPLLLNGLPLDKESGAPFILKNHQKILDKNFPGKFKILPVWTHKATDSDRKRVPASEIAKRLGSDQVITELTPKNLELIQNSKGIMITGGYPWMVDSLAQEALARALQKALENGATLYANSAAANLSGEKNSQAFFSELGGGGFFQPVKPGFHLINASIFTHAMDKRLLKAYDQKDPNAFLKLLQKQSNQIGIGIPVGSYVVINADKMAIGGSKEVHLFERSPNKHRKLQAGQSYPLTSASGKWGEKAVKVQFTPQKPIIEVPPPPSKTKKAPMQNHGPSDAKSDQVKRSQEIFGRTKRRSF